MPRRRSAVLGLVVLFSGCGGVDGEVYSSSVGDGEGENGGWLLGLLGLFFWNVLYPLGSLLCQYVLLCRGGGGRQGPLVTPS